MKKKKTRISAFLLILSIAFTLPFLTACGKKNKDDDLSAILLNTVEEYAKTKQMPVPDILYEEYTNGVLSFDISKSWHPVDGDEGCFYTSDYEIAYGLNGRSYLGGRSAEEFFDLSKIHYQNLGYTIIESSDIMDEWTSSDGVFCQSGSMVLKADDVYTIMELIGIPDKNMTVSFFGIYNNVANQSSAYGVMEQFKKSLQFPISDQDIISGNTYLVDLFSALCLKEDGEFYYYRLFDDHSKEYFVGSYEVFRGQDAFDYFDSLESQPELTEYLEASFEASLDGYYLNINSGLEIAFPELLEFANYPFQVSKDTLYAIVLHNDYIVMETDLIEDGGYDSLYIGYYIPELEMISAQNMSSMDYSFWSYVDKTSQLDIEPVVEVN